MSLLSFPRGVFLGIAFAVAVGAALPAQAQTKKKKTKTTPSSVAGPYVLGTKQLPGDFGVLGKTYTIGVNDPLNVTVTGAAYAVDRYVVNTLIDGQKVLYPTPDQKLLVLRMTVQNPNPREIQFGHNSLVFTAIGADSQSQQTDVAFLAGTMEEPNAMPLKPAQKIAIWTAIPVAARGEVPKLMVQRSNDSETAAVLRYDLRGKAAAPQKWAASDATVPEVLTITPETLFPFSLFDLGVRGLEWVTTPINGETLENGERFLVVHNAVRTMVANAMGNIFFEIKTADGEILKQVGLGNGNGNGLLLARRDSPWSLASFDKGTVGGMRVFFRVPKDVEAKTLFVREDGMRSYQLAVSPDWFMIRDCVRDAEHVKP